MRFISYLFMVIAVVVMSGCATMTESECATADWHDVGYKDGRNGKPRDYMQERSTDCAKRGYALDAKKYQAGRDQGIAQYCTAENGRSEGLKGHPYLDACPAQLERDFLAPYRAAKRVYDAQEKVDELNRQSDHLTHQLKKEKQGSKRQGIRQELREIDDKLSDARKDLRHEENRLHDLKL